MRFPKVCLRIFVSYSESAFHKMPVSSVSVINVSTGNMAVQFQDLIYYNFSSCSYFCNFCFWSQSAFEGLRIQPIIDLKWVIFWIPLLLQKYKLTTKYQTCNQDITESVTSRTCNNNVLQENASLQTSIRHLSGPQTISNVLLSYGQNLIFTVSCYTKRLRVILHKM